MEENTAEESTDELSPQPQPLNRQNRAWELLGNGKKPALVLAPMVDASELAWRLLARRYGANLTYSPMFHAANFLRDHRYRKEALQIDPLDRPFIIQMCGNEPETLLGSALLAQEHCDCIDLNLGCPQSIAKRGHYGAFLQDDWSLVSRIVKRLSSELSVPVSCKVRVFESMERTVSYAKMLEASGCSLLTVHGRTRDQKGPLTGLASWAHIRAVKENVTIPVIGNGNVQCLEDALRLAAETGVDGVMSAEGHLTNPCLFAGLAPPAWEPALEYLSIAEVHPAPNSYVRGHIFKMLHSLFALKENSEVRELVAKGSSLEDFKQAVLQLRDKYLPVHEGILPDPHPPTPTDYNLCLPPWICQPYIRPPPEVYIHKMEQIAKESQEKEKENQSVGEKRAMDSPEGEVLSKKKQKRLARRQRPGAPNPQPCLPRKEMPICTTCPNPLGGKCIYKLCKCCCKKKCYTEEADCPGHGILVKTRRETARKHGKPHHLSSSQPATT